MIETFDFGWGEPYCVREALKVYYKRIIQKPININSLGYSEEPGTPLLVKLTKEFIREVSGVDYKYVIITNGTIGAINSVLRTLAKEGKDTCYTHKYVFPYYKHILEKNNYKHLTGLYKDHEQQLNEKNTIALVDSPSNPEGDLLLYTDHNNSIIWDSVYHNPVFINGIAVKPDHRVNCGSYSKVLGLTGVRIGWIATNSEEDYNKYLLDNVYENCTISLPSQDLIIDVLNNTDLLNFMTSARYRINNNREMFDRIIYMFDGQAVPEDGMFFVAWAVPYTVKLLDKLGIKYILLDKQRNDKFLRFNLAQTNELTTKAIKLILKEDRR